MKELKRLTLIAIAIATLFECTSEARTKPEDFGDYSYCNKRFCVWDLDDDGRPDTVTTKEPYKLLKYSPKTKEIAEKIFGKNPDSKKMKRRDLSKASDMYSEKKRRN